MTGVELGSDADRRLPAAVARRFEAIMFNWAEDGVRDRRADWTRLRVLVEEACAVGIELAIVSGAHLGVVDGQLRARPSGPGRLLLALNHGSEIFIVDATDRRLVERRTATAAEDAALSEAAALTVQRLATRGLPGAMVSERLNRRVVDLVPRPRWSDPLKPRTEDLLAALDARLDAAGIDGMTETVLIARAAAADAGLTDAKVTCDPRHVEIGLTDDSDATRWIIRELWRSGIEPSQVLTDGDGLGAFRGDLAMFAGVLEDQIARRRDHELPAVSRDAAWTLSVGHSEPFRQRVDESLLTLGDGRLGTRGSRLAADPADDPSVLVAGVYTGRGPETELLTGPSWSTIELDATSQHSDRRSLNLRTGTLSHELAGGGDQFAAIAFSSLARPASTILRVRGSTADPPPTGGLKAPAGAEHRRGVTDGCAWVRVIGSPGSIVTARHERVTGRAPDRDTPWVLDRLTCYDGAAAGFADEGAVLKRVANAGELGFEGLLSEHRRAWATRWEEADVTIDGDAELQLGVRLALFHLMASVADRGEAAVGARGLSGTGYRGHVFWDSDVYVLPFLAATHPDAARAMLEYRVRRLPVSLAAAQADGHAGARFAWESAASGEDMTPFSVANGRGGVDRIYSGQQEEHIVADVAWAAAHYIDWTGDEAFASGPGRELLVQTARWWASRIERDEDGSAHIRGVMGPDEYHDSVDDDAYTNVMARWNLRRAAEALPAGQLDRREAHRWCELAEALVDGYDAVTGIYEQFAGFNALEPIVIAKLAERRPVAADVLLGQKRTRGAQVVKQPDVLMLHYLVPEELVADSLGPNLDFYDPRTAHGSTLSMGVHAALMARAHRMPEAVELLRRTSRIDLDDVGGVTAGGLHVAAMGSVWRALAFGFAGLAPVHEALRLDPVLPAGWNALEVRVTFRGSRVRIRIQADAVEVRASPPVVVLSPGGDRVMVGDSGQSFETARAWTAKP